jgi:hypothetical protein
MVSAWICRGLVLSYARSIRPTTARPTPMRLLRPYMAHRRVCKHPFTGPPTHSNRFLMLPAGLQTSRPASAHSQMLNGIPMSRQCGHHVANARTADSGGSACRHVLHPHPGQMAPLAHSLSLTTVTSQHIVEHAVCTLHCGGERELVIGLQLNELDEPALCLTV